MALYRGWDLDAMKDAGENAALQTDVDIPPSRFTPINRPGTQLPTPQSSAGLPLSNRVNSSQQRGKRHNPVIAQYLGLGANQEPSRLGRYAPVLPPTPTTPPKSGKRARNARDGSSPTKTDRANPKKPKQQRRVSDSFRVAKPASRNLSRKTEDVSLANVSTSSPNGTKSAVDSSKEAERQERTHSANATVKGPVKAPNRTNPATLIRPSSTHIDSSCNAPSSHSVQPLDEHQTQDTDEYFDDVFDSIDLDSTLDQLAGSTQPEGVQHTWVGSGRGIDLDANNAAIYVDDDFFSSTPDLTDDFSSPGRPDGVNHGNASMIADEDPAGSAASKPLHDSNAPGPSGKFVSPVTQRTKDIVRKEAMGVPADRKPIVRLLSPDAVRDRSPIIGLSSNLTLRTCFRIGEAINQASHATKHGRNVMFELYARVLSSERDALKQHFVFSDLFHDRPPYLKGEYDAAIWKHVELFNYDSGRLLSKAKICRCIGKIKRDGNKEWIMVVLNIWEATWEDIDWVEGIVNS